MWWGIISRFQNSFYSTNALFSQTYVETDCCFIWNKTGHLNKVRHAPSRYFWKGPVSGRKCGKNRVFNMSSWYDAYSEPDALFRSAPAQLKESQKTSTCSLHPQPHWHIGFGGHLSRWTKSTIAEAIRELSWFWKVLWNRRTRMNSFVFPSCSKIAFQSSSFFLLNLCQLVPDNNNKVSTLVPQTTHLPAQ